jgi:predicted PurR-regulated permease PerM
VLLGLPGVLLALPLVVVLQVVSQEVLVRDVMDRWEGDGFHNDSPQASGETIAQRGERA